MIKLTEQEKQIIDELNDKLYTVEFVEEWINRDDNVIINPFAALQAMGAKGYHQAVKRMAALRGQNDPRAACCRVCGCGADH